MSESKAWLFWLIILLSIIGLSAGALIAFGLYWQAGGVVVGTWVAWGAVTYLVPVFHNYAYDMPAETVQQVVERVTLVIKVPGQPDKYIHGLSRQEIQNVGECVTYNDAYDYSVTHFKDYFKNSDVDGYALYGKAIRWMKDVGALVPNSKGGVDVTDPIGKYVFDAMRDEHWEIIEDYDTLPYPVVS